MRIYISGPISGKDPEETREAFGRVADLIRETGNVPVNPREINGWALSWGAYMQIGFDVIRSGEIDLVYMLRGWEESHGACLERYFAMLQGIPVTYQSAEDREKFGRRTRK